MDDSTMVVCLAAMVLLAVVIGFALYFKADVRAGGRYRDGEFYIEAKGRRK